ncbi:hypothetical protein B0I35DRAFT_431766 [Stachybotrys elegans]|uniref:Uncharacterized protein n=1 Tax=Stachybotrys elegans TaxID=80388 RepID=A0A8K0SW61_9HYPO|nr:hypothetical protein B0I35DRAFT_431766 [Stachybotrys elegans]
MLRLGRPLTWKQSSWGRQFVRHLHPSTPCLQSQASRIDRITARLPRSLQKYTNGLRNAPVSHIVSFLILHELTAIVPLFALVGFFHYTDYVPVSYMTQHFGSYVEAGTARFEKYFRRKGWFGFGQDEPTSAMTTDSNDGGRTRQAMERWQEGEAKYKILMEVALAYAITKALLPVRIIGSVWAAPWFANRVLLRARSLFTRKT